MMKMWFRFGVISMLTMLAAGCAGMGPMTGEGPPVSERSTEGPGAAAGAAGEMTPEGQAPSTLSGSPAVVALLTRADRQARGGDASGAAATLERALRIEPRNPALWHQLAAVRMAQGNYSLAESLAQKSNVLAGDDKALQARNWQIIALARGAQGNAAGARTARQKAAELGGDSR